MAVTATLVRASKYRLFYAISHDGAAGDTLTISNATLQADADGREHILKVLQTAVQNNAEAVQLLMAGVGAVTRITSGKLVLWAVDAQETGQLADLLIEGEAGTINDGILELQVLHTIDK
jgi:hypothetical protein